MGRKRRGIPGMRRRWNGPSRHLRDTAISKRSRLFIMARTSTASPEWSGISSGKTSRHRKQSGWSRIRAMEFDFGKRILHWFTILVAGSVLVLICSGGLVTSHEAGMAVPDWPNSFGYSMFLFPVSRWVGGVFFEHTHRLIASGVGLLTLLLCGITFVIEQRRWVRWLTGIAVVAVIIQGILGGLRVTEHNALLGLFHGCLAQSFFCLTAVIALVTSRFWTDIKAAAELDTIRHLTSWTIGVTVMIFVQLAMGASMRHSHTGLS